MSGETKSCKHDSSGSLACGIWAIGWLFTIGLTKLIWWKAILAVLLWPYYLGAALTQP